jgi:dTDP-4-dehydrorhamnose reductase
LTGNTNSLLVIGGSGYLGQHLTAAASVSGRDVTATFHTRPGSVATAEWRRLDITRRELVADLVEELRPAVIVNAAVDRSMSGWMVNAAGPAYVALAAARRGCRLIHVSTDGVFSGEDGPYDEFALPNPFNNHGAAKAAGETAVRAILPGSAIVRTSLILGEASRNEQLVLDAISGRSTTGLYHAEWRSPVDVHDLTAAILELADLDYAGVLNVAGADGVTPYDIGCLIARRKGVPEDTVPKCSRDTGQQRPGDARLSIDRARHLLRTKLRGAHEFLVMPTSCW